MQNQHIKRSEKLAFEEPWIHHHSGGVWWQRKRETVITSHCISRHVNEVVEKCQKWNTLFHL